MENWAELGVGGMFALLVLKQVFEFLKTRNGNGKNGNGKNGKTVLPDAVLMTLQSLQSSVSEIKHDVNEIKEETNWCIEKHKHEAPGQPGIMNWWITERDRSIWLKTSDGVSRIEKQIQELRNELV